MRRFALCVLFLSGLWTISVGQLSLNDLISGGKHFSKYRPEAKSVSFRPESNELIVREGDVLYTQGVRTKMRKPLLHLTQLNQWMKQASYMELKSLPQMQWETQDRFVFTHQGAVLFVDLKEEKVGERVRLPKGARHANYCAENNYFAFTQGNSLFLVQGDESPELVAESEDPAMVYGQVVHRNEFGIDKGIFWSPGGRALAFYKKDESMVSDYPLVNINTRVAGLKNIKYPMAGMASHEVSVGIYDRLSKKTVYLETGEPKDRYFTNISWTPDAKYVLVAELNRAQDHMQFKKYDASTGKLDEVLFEEKSEVWVEPSHPAVSLHKDPSKYLWQSKRSGFNHIYMYDLERGFKKAITQGDWEVTKLLYVSKNDDFIIIECTKDSPLERQIYRVDMKTGALVRITKEPGVHRAQVSDDGNYVLTHFSSLQVPGKTQVYSNKGVLQQQLHEAKNPFEGMELASVEMITLKTKDGKHDLYGRLVLPPHFDAQKKYPVIIYVYGGPHSQMVQNSWQAGSRGWQLYMAQQGYIALTLDNRGTYYRGQAFEQAIHRQLGQLEVEDQMQGVAYLKSLPYVDAERIGVHGWSYGGFMTLSMMMQYPDVFKVGVAGGPVIDWKYYEVMYGERYMDKPQENPEGYLQSDLTQHVDKLKGRALVIHGSQDPVVVWQHSLRFVTECVQKGVQVDYFPYPNHEHNVIGKDRIHLMEKVSRYFEDFL